LQLYFALKLDTLRTQSQRIPHTTKAVILDVEVMSAARSCLLAIYTVQTTRFATIQIQAINTYINQLATFNSGLKVYNEIAFPSK